MSKNMTEIMPPVFWQKKVTESMGFIGGES